MDDQPMKLCDLSSRQRQIVVLVSKGFEDKEIAGKLDLDISTVKQHLKLARLKCGVSNRVGLIFHFFNVTQKE